MKTLMLSLLVNFLLLFSGIGFDGTACLLAFQLSGLSDDLGLAKSYPADGRESVVGFRISLTPENARSGELITLKIEGQIESGWSVSALNESDESEGSSVDFAVIGLDEVDARFIPLALPRDDSKVGDCHRKSFVWLRRYRVRKTVFAGIGEINILAFREESSRIESPLIFSLQPTVRSNSKHIPTLAGNSNSVTTSELPDRGKSILATAHSSIEYSDPAISGLEKNKKSIKKRSANSIVLQLSECNLTRPKVKLSSRDLLEELQNEPSETVSTSATEDRLVFKAELMQDGKKVNLYLPEATAYSLKNNSTGSTRFTNTSTYISIDHDGDGYISGHESNALCAPFRVWDSMYQVLEIDCARRELRIEKKDMALCGAIKNRVCPPFEFTTLEGQTISDQTIRGKVTILDLMGMT